MVYADNIYGRHSNSQLGDRSGRHHCNLAHLQIHVRSPNPHTEQARLNIHRVGTGVLGDLPKAAVPRNPTVEWLARQITAARFSHRVANVQWNHCPREEFEWQSGFSRTLPKAVVDAINRKIEQYYIAEEYRFRVAREIRESERKKIGAEGISEFQRIVSEGIPNPSTSKRPTPTSPSKDPPIHQRKDHLPVD